MGSLSNEMRLNNHKSAILPLVSIIKIAPSINWFKMDYRNHKSVHYMGGRERHTRITNTSDQFAIRHRPRLTNHLSVNYWSHSMELLTLPLYSAGTRHEHLECGYSRWGDVLLYLTSTGKFKHRKLLMKRLLRKYQQIIVKQNMPKQCYICKNVITFQRRLQMYYLCKLFANWTIYISILLTYKKRNGNLGVYST